MSAVPHTLDALFSVRGKIALVSGGTSGIGHMIAAGLVANGVRTYITSRDAGPAEAVAARLARQGDCRAIRADLSDQADIAALADTLQSLEPRLDILVNAAGIHTAAPIDTFDESSWNSVLDLNLKAVFFLTQKLLPLLRNAGTATDPARIINIGSVGGLHVPNVENYAYLASKSAVHHLTRAMAKRLAPDHVTVNAIAPGPFPSRMFNDMPAQFQEAIRLRIPRGRLGEQADVIGLSIFLASRAGAFVSGTVIPLDGGYTGAS